MTLVEIANPADFAGVQDVLAREPCAFLIGSAVSIFPPTDIPAGAALARDIVEFLLAGQAWTDPEEEQIARKFAGTCAFESLLEHYPKLDHLKAHFAGVMSGKSPNPVHGAIIAAAARSGAPIVTTNYDDLIEQAGAASGAAFGVVIDEGDIGGVSSAVVPIFKIHGCVHRPASLVVRMSEEPIGATWKNAYLETLVCGRNLFVIGYSGQDFDICPALIRAGVKRLFWSVRDYAQDRPGFSQHLNALVQSGAPLTLVCGDLQLLLGLSPVRPAASGFSLSAFLQQDLTAGGAALWRAEFFAFIGIEPAVRRLLPQLAPDDAERLKAVCDFMRGYHRKAFESWSAPRLSAPERSLLKSIRLRNSGRLTEARWRLAVFAAGWRRVPLAVKRRAVRHLRYSLLLNRHAAGSPAWRRQVRRLLRSALAAGAWTEVSQLLAILQHAGVNAAALGFDWALLPPVAGSRHIGGAVSHIHEFARAAFRTDPDEAAFGPVIALAERFEFNGALMLLYDAALCSRRVIGLRRRAGLLLKLWRAYAASEVTAITKIVYSLKAFAIFLRLRRHIPV